MPALLRTILSRVLAVIAILAIAAMAFYFWATHGQLQREAYDHGEIIAAPNVAGGEADNEYTIVTYNVGYASGMSNNSGANAAESEYAANLDKIIAALEGVRPDLVAFQEIDYGAKRSYGQRQLAAVGDALALKYRAKAYNWDRNYLPFPYWPPSEHFGRVLSGQAIASAFPVTEHSKVTLIQPSERPFYYNAFYLDRIVQIVKIDVGGHPLTLLNVHLEAYMQNTREVQSREVIEVVHRYNDGPLILLGDFNAAPAWFQERGASINRDVDTELRGDDTIANILNHTGLQLAIPESDYAGDRIDTHNTFSSASPSAPIDHIFYNDHIEKLDARVIADAGTGSDHLPLLMRFKFHDTELPGGLDTDGPV